GWCRWCRASGVACRGAQAAGWGRRRVRTWEGFRSAKQEPHRPGSGVEESPGLRLRRLHRRAAVRGGLRQHRLRRRRRAAAGAPALARLRGGARPPMTAPAPSVTLCWHPVPCQHVCAFVSSTDEQYRILNPYFREALRAGESLLTIVGADLHDERLGRMRVDGVVVDAGLDSGQLTVLASIDTYLRDGIFVVDRMYALLDSELQADSNRPWSRIRVYGEHDWILRNLQTTD